MEKACDYKTDSPIRVDFVSDSLSHHPIPSRQSRRRLEKDPKSPLYPNHSLVRHYSSTSRLRRPGSPIIIHRAYYSPQAALKGDDQDFDIVFQPNFLPNMPNPKLKPLGSRPKQSMGRVNLFRGPLMNYEMIVKAYGENVRVNPAWVTNPKNPLLAYLKKQEYDGALPIELVEGLFERKTVFRCVGRILLSFSEQAGQKH